MWHLADPTEQNRATQSMMNRTEDTSRHPPLDHKSSGDPATLARSLSVWHALLYGLGITIGAGIYVLIGPMAAAAGFNAPFAVLLAALLMTPTALSLAELATRMPVAAGEAAYVEKGFRSVRLGTAVGLLVIAIAITTTATISLGAAEYIRLFVAAPEAVIVTAVVVVMGAIAAWGIVESITFAGIMTLIETGGLLLIAGAGFFGDPSTVTRLPEIVPTLTLGHVTGIMIAGMLAVFAFVGFEGIVNIAEEVKNPRRDLPRALIGTLAITAALYIAVTWVALIALGPETLGETKAPLAAVFEKLTGLPPVVMALIAIVATLNGIIASIILASRVAYGLSRHGELPPLFGHVHPSTRTPLAATAIATAISLGLALSVPLEGLADLTSQLTLAMFAMVNLALVLIKSREAAPPPDTFVTPRLVPLAGFVATIGVIAADILI